MEEQIKRTKKEQFDLLKILLETKEVREDRVNILVQETKGLFCWEGTGKIYYGQKGASLGSMKIYRHEFGNEYKVERSRDSAVYYLENEKVLFGRTNSECGYGYYRYLFNYENPISLEEAINDSLFNTNEIIERLTKRIKYKRSPKGKF